MSVLTKKNPGHFLTLAICLGLLFLLLTGCDGGADKEGTGNLVRLDQLAQLPARHDEPAAPVLRVGVGAILSPQGTARAYQPLVDYLGRRLGQPAVLVQRRTYQELNDLLARNMMDLAFICTGAYLEASKRREVSLLAVPQVNGKTTYRSLVIVPASSPAREFADLRGKVFAFTDPLSNTGYFCPMSLLSRMNQQPETFFARTIFTYSHDRSIAAVLEGVADGAAVDSLVYEFALRRDPGLEGKFRIIRESAEFGIPPVVVPMGISEEKKARLKELLLGLHLDPEGAKVLGLLGVDRFVEPDPGRY